MEALKSDFCGFNLDFYKNTHEDQKITLLFIHGNSSTKRIFKEQFQDKVLRDYNIVALDLPGHGSSYKVHPPHRPYYTIELYGKSVVHLINDLKLKNIVLVGHSLGAHVTTLVSKSIKVRGVFNIQNTPINSVSDLALALNQSPVYNSFFNNSFTNDELKKLEDVLFFNKKVPHDFLTDFSNTNPSCRSDLAQYIQAHPSIEEIDHLSSLKGSYCLALGSKDEFINDKYIRGLTAFKNNIKKIKNAGHFPMLENPTQFNQTLKDFIELVK